MQSILQSYPTHRFFLRFSDRVACLASKQILRILVLLFTMSFTQEVRAQARGASPEVTRKDQFDREVDFIDFLLGERLFAYVNLAMEELRRAFPDETDRIRVAEATVMLRQGRTEQVEELLRGMNLRTDDKAQAILLQLAMTYDNMGQGDAARGKYNQFLEVVRGQDIDDPDVIRFFAGAAMRLAAILTNAGQYEQAAQAVRQVIETSDEDVLKRKFRILLIQTHLDHGLSLSGNPRNAAFARARSEVNEILWGANDNYWFMAMAQNAWLDHLEGQTSEALTALNDIRQDAQRLERQMEEADPPIPKSEFPRALMRYARGRILFDLAKRADSQGNVQASRSRAGESATHLYNAFLQYEGNEYASRAGLKYEEVRVWILEKFNIVIDPGANVRDPSARETIFKRQLDLADELVRSNQRQEAERLLLNALSQYPMTRYTLGALNSLGRIWLEEERYWELITLAQYVADLYPDDSTAANMLLRWGQKMVAEENDFGIENVLGAFGRNFPGHPRAPAMLFEIARRAQDQREFETAQRFYDEVIAYHPGSAAATRVLTMQAAEALRSENYEEAVRVFTIVRDQAPPGFQRAQASLGIADAKLRSDDPEMRREGLTDLKALRDRLQPSDGSIYYRGDDAERSARLLRRVRFNVGQSLIRHARHEDSDELRQRAVAELNSFIADYPDDLERIPLAMHGVGRVYLQQGQFDRATQTFNTLARDYPDSEVGRDALFSLVSAALEEEQIEVAREAVSRMIDQPDSYEPEQIFQVGNLMLENNRYTEALSSYELVLRSPRASEDAAFGLRVAVNLGKAAMGVENYERAVEVLGRLVEENPNSSLVVDAGILLSQAYIELEQFEAADRALQPVARLLRSRQDSVGQAKLGIASGNVSKAAGNSGVALIDYYGVALQDPSSSEHRVLVQDAIHRALDIALPEAEAGDRMKWEMVLELAVQHIQHFPADRRHVEMQELQRRARGNIQ